LSGVFENQRSSVVQLDFLGLPRWALVESVGIAIRWIPGTVEPVEVRLFIGDPFLYRLPGRLDRLHRFDVERRRWWTGELDDTLPKAMKAEEEFDLLWALDGPGEFHGSFATRALQRIGSPDFENHVAPEWAHGAGGLFRRGWDEENLGLEI